MRYLFLILFSLPFGLYIWGPGSNLIATEITQHLSISGNGTVYGIVGLPDKNYDRVCLGSNEGRLFHTNQRVICAGCVKGWRNKSLLFTGWKKNRFYLAAFKGSKYEIFPVQLDAYQSTVMTSSYSRKYEIEHKFCATHGIMSSLKCLDWNGKCLLVFDELNTTPGT
jgi:hypothetical protein